ncbi:hypothetical protein [Pedococcus sp.]|jgi:hypothetical protein|uniref:hypothetical protein n=1 Tax=Pedococcus sp. TaxID=2860345 RepID=UPI002E0E742B|nr:hypothetical protein [Pedococcus sp.]
MSIAADPLFIAAEVQWRTRQLSGAATPLPTVHRPHRVRDAVVGRLHHRHGRPAAPRIA